MKDRNGQVIGFEKLNFVPVGREMPLVSFETMDGHSCPITYRPGSFRSRLSAA